MIVQFSRLPTSRHEKGGGAAVPHDGPLEPDRLNDLGSCLSPTRQRGPFEPAGRFGATSGGVYRSLLSAFAPLAARSASSCSFPESAGTHSRAIHITATVSATPLCCPSKALYCCLHPTLPLTFCGCWPISSLALTYHQYHLGIQYGATSGRQIARSSDRVISRRGFRPG